MFPVNVLRFDTISEDAIEAETVSVVKRSIAFASATVISPFTFIVSLPSSDKPDDP